MNIQSVWSVKKFFKTHHGQIRWTILSNTPLTTHQIKTTTSHLAACLDGACWACEGPVGEEAVHPVPEFVVAGAHSESVEGEEDLAP